MASLLMIGCEKDNSGQDNSGQDPDQDVNASEWLIPKDQVLDGGPGKDGIPAIQNPDFIPASQAAYLSDEDLVLGFVDGDEARAYPHPILDWHEIVNDDINSHSVSVIYCPLTGTGIGWDRMINNTKTTFGVSGLLYNSNIIPYDRATDSNWSQLLLKSVQGPLAGTSAKTHNLVETTWETWKKLYPSTWVLSANTGHNRSYGRYPYGTYKTDNRLIFPVSNDDNRLHQKERVLALIANQQARAYRFESFGEGISMITDEFDDKKIVVAGSNQLNLMVAFYRELASGTLLDFDPVLHELPVILVDHEGTRWDVFGRGVDGPRAGQQLDQPVQMMGYWFAFAAFYPDVSIY